MKNIVGVLFCILCFYTLSFSQYQVKSKYLLEPELNFGFVDSCARFWLNSYDESLGGFYTNVDRQGNVITQWGTNKNMLTQSRNAYGMVRAFMLTGKEEFLEKAKSALEFMYSSTWDNNNSGWFGQADKNGNPINPSGNKSAFDQHYALLGILAYYEATGDTTAWNWFRKGFLNNEEKLWDNSANQFGYYHLVNSSWTNKNGKSFNATVDAVTTHLLNAYLLTGEEIYRERLIDVADNIINRLVSTMDSYKIGFVENFNTDWTWNDNTANDNRRTIMGHVLKSGWVLGRIHQVIPNDSYLEAAEKLVMSVWEKGYDHKYGGPYKDYDRVTGDMYFYGQDTAKAWWQMEQAIVAGLELYDLTKNEIYLQMADESLDFFMDYFVDHTYGEIYADLFRDGSNIPAWGTTKGNGGKAGYHSIETGYYVYTYGNLFYHYNSIELFYKFEPVNYDRNITLLPIATNKNLNISEVFLGENSYDSFSSENNTLYIAAGTGGKYKVVFGSDAAVSVSSLVELPQNFTLSQNYPNPFNPSTNIRFTIPISGNVSLKIYNSLGEEIKVVVDSYMEAGIHHYNFSGKKYSSGTYFYTLKYGGNILTKKMMLVK